ncbi:DUF928 domain-containing protein [Anabaena cylindrica FACHB-243]|uniref:DUF928 domain-containing protein n=1 Tax=Anabaena cylindrica (strain ATCC 27899 / PCC 7122) TaxID=272123 RepID=K9ZBH9_ANACC|nr:MULTISPECIES: DUF928 domain-containing protein [Anabaena]AFZ56563.1 protein of unknown function DUF928 [Anabaena cylindrica PCC 7122]MBD2420819.1 DUF928 domain-containing protein [Anabaena cylindrica FACHB-243]MBY5284504.1 DUF928 domain-containing protein [Anabaena sp. CCAP 1446/1C]MBY5311058.1 DUF928 domain-containing protein [Anabaena sp. CCAP 1446/1C]MCM2408856.1 DUF928 domain-containing protein [Anabaena sp. CCAP 1446/1C]
MNLQKYINSLTLGKIAVGISPALITLSTFSLPSSAQLSPSLQLPTTPNSKLLAQLQFPSAPDRGKPQRTGAGGRRGNSCIISQNDQPSLTALMPTWDNNGQTVSNNPELYVYVPQINTKSGEFVLIDEEGNEVYQTNFIPPDQPGIVKLTIPSNADLKVGKKYQWFFTIVCNSEDRSQDEYVSGSLERTTLGSLLNNYLQQVAPLKQAEIYAKNRIWHDTISNAADLRTENPDVWLQLLKSVGLEELEKEPFVDFGTPKP